MLIERVIIQMKILKDLEINIISIIKIEDIMIRFHNLILRVK